MNKTFLRAVGITIAVAAIGLATYLKEVAWKVAPQDIGDPYKLGDQYSALGGIIIALLVDPVVRDRRLMMVAAPLALIIGAVAPWLYRLIPGSSVWHGFAMDLESPGAGAFTFGIAFLVKSLGVNDEEVTAG